MWVILKFNKKNLSFLKKDFLKYLGNDVKFYLPKLKLQKKIKNRLQDIESFLLGDYLLCFHKSFENKNVINSLKYCKGLKYFLNNFQEAQDEIKNAAEKCDGADQARCMELAEHCEYVNGVCQDKEPPSTVEAEPEKKKAD